MQKKIKWTAEDRARHKAIRERFKSKPTVDELIASGELSGETMPLGDYLSILEAAAALKKAREAAGLSLTDVAERSGIDRAALSRIENGQHRNPTVTTLQRYARVLGLRWVWSLQKLEPAATESK